MNQHLQKLLDSDFEVSFGDAYDKAWDYFKENTLNMILYAVVMLLISIGSLLLWLIPIIGWYFAIGIQYALGAGIFTYLRAYEKGNAEFSNFFDAYSNFKQLAIYGILLFLISLPMQAIGLAFVPWDLVQEAMENPSAAESIMEEYLVIAQQNSSAQNIYNIINILVGAVLTTLFIYGIPFIVDQDIKATKAISLSAKLALKNFVQIFLMIIVFYVILFVGGVCTCAIGFVILFPLMYCLHFAVYRLTVGRPQEESRLDDFGISEENSNME